MAEKVLNLLHSEFRMITGCQPSPSSLVNKKNNSFLKTNFANIKFAGSKHEHTHSKRFPTLYASFKSEKGPRFSISNPHLPRVSKFACHAQNPSQEQFEFQQRLETVWGINKQPPPVPCDTCNGEGEGECPWCKGTGFFVLGDNLLCEIPSKNTTCRICHGQGTLPCTKCRGTGFRAKWIAINPPP